MNNPIRNIPHVSGTAGAGARVVLDPEMQNLFNLIERLGPSTIPVLLLGETGSGKEVLADWLHRTSCLRAQPLIKINCAGLTESVVESELFGHERGAFTGAHEARRGLFSVADRGTLFLDELAELSLRTQAKLLRVLETGELSPLGSSRVQTVNVRVVAATHSDLGALIAQGMFRRDLYFRLNGVTVALPPLRRRRAEILPLAHLFLNRAATRLDRPGLRLARSAEQALTEYDWPGNIRELRNVIECAAALCLDSTITRAALTLGRPVGSVGAMPTERDASVLCPAWTVEEVRASPAVPLKGELRHFERIQIVAALDQSGGNQTRAARLLGISRRTLTKKLTLHALPRPRKGPERSASRPGAAE